MRYTIFLSVASIVVGVYGRESLQPLRNVYRYHAYCAAYCLMVCTSILAHNFPSPIFFPSEDGAMLLPPSRNAIDSTIPGDDWGNGTNTTGKMEKLGVRVNGGYIF